MPTPFIRRRSYLPFYLELVAEIIARLLYRVRTAGLEHFPKAAGVLRGRKDTSDPTYERF